MVNSIKYIQFLIPPSGWDRLLISCQDQLGTRQNADKWQFFGLLLSEKRENCKLVELLWCKLYLRVSHFYFCLDFGELLNGLSVYMDEGKVVPITRVTAVEPCYIYLELGYLEFPAISANSNHFHLYFSHLLSAISSPRSTFIIWFPLRVRDIGVKL